MRKYKILFFLGIGLLAFQSYGQFQVGFEGSGVIPLEFSFELARNDKGGLPIEIHSHADKMGYRLAPFISLKMDRHRLGFKPSYFFLPGERVNNEYLKYRVPDIQISTFAFNYGYFLSDKFHLNAELGVAYFLKPSTVTGLNMGLGLGYVLGKFDIETNLIHIRKNGHLNLITIGVSYKILDNL